jgi:hypothetical protein
LGRGLAALHIEIWRQAYDLATRLDATEGFVDGLALVPKGIVLLDELGIAVTRSLDVALHAAHARSSARSIEWFRHLPLAKKVRWFLKKSFPTPQFMRLWHPLARHSGWGLALAYIWRPVWLVKELPMGLIERRRVRKEIERSAPPNA